MGVKFNFFIIVYLIVFSLFSENISAQSRIWKPGSTSAFEVGTQVRAWEIRDEGMGYILDNIQSMCAVNSLYMVVVMHQEHRPYMAPEFPHDPVRDIWDAEDSRVTFFPDMSRYGEIKPLLSDTAWIRETDWLKLMIDSCRSRGLAVGAEVSHFPIPKGLIKENKSWQQKTIDGKYDPKHFCPNNPIAREYVINLFGDLAANYDLDYIQTCQILFTHNNIDRGGVCFCDNCIEMAPHFGFDLKSAIPILKANKNSQEQFDLFRQKSTTEFYRLISEEIKRVKKNPHCHLRYNDTQPFTYRNDIIEHGLDLGDVSKYLGSVVNQDHEEQKGEKGDNFKFRQVWLERNRNYIGSEMPLICGIAPRITATPEIVKKGIMVALNSPANVNGLVLKHYDGASFGLMRAFKQGMIEAGVMGIFPTIGMEVEDMNLDNYTRINDFVEEWGVKTEGKGTASYDFDNASANYDVRITYYDGNAGQSQVTLFIAGVERAKFKMDEDTGCWRYREFKNIHVNKGDKIMLVGTADKEEGAILDFIEFIPANR